MLMAQGASGAEHSNLRNKFQIEHDIVNDPNWQEAEKLASFKRGQEVELGSTKKQHQLVVGAGLEPGNYRF